MKPDRDETEAGQRRDRDRTEMGIINTTVPTTEHMSGRHMEHYNIA